MDMPVVNETSDWSAIKRTPWPASGARPMMESAWCIVVLESVGVPLLLSSVSVPRKPRSALLKSSGTRYCVDVTHSLKREDALGRGAANES